MRLPERIGEVAYRLALPEGSKIHPVFHISQIKKAIGNKQAAATQLTVEGELKTEPERLLALRNKSNGENIIVEVLIKWEGLQEFEATWEQADVIAEQFRSFHLEDKVAVLAGGIAMNGTNKNKPFDSLTFVRSRFKKKG